jgi:aspartate/methionine/tyrosine aminotransferase
MFSSRTRWDRTENRLTGLLAAKRRSGARVLDLTESNPTHAGIPCPADVLLPLAEPGSLQYDPEPRGLLAARQAVAADCSRRGVDVSPDRIVLTASTSEAYSFALRLLCDPGDSVLVPRPSYPLFDFLAGLASVALERYPLAHDGSWHLDLPALGARVSRSTRAVVVVSPNNPTGSFLKRDEADRLLGFCGERGIAVVADEVFSDYAFEADPRRLAALHGDDRALVLSFGGLSKSCGLPQLKLGWIAVSGPRGLCDEALARLDIIADTYLSVGTPVQRAAPAILARLPELQRPIAARLTANLSALRGRLGATSAATLLDPEGGWSAVLRLPATIPEEERVCRLLERHDVLVHPGYFFEFESEAYVVLSLLTPEETFVAGVERILADV